MIAQPRLGWFAAADMFFDGADWQPFPLDPVGLVLSCGVDGYTVLGGNHVD
jgi:hypothetical protein